MQQITDQQYLSRFERMERIWNPTIPYEVGFIVYLTGDEFTGAVADTFWIAAVANINEEPTAENSEFWTPFTPPETIGEGQFITLEDIVNNYMVAYNDDSTQGGEKMRYKVEFFAQRLVQEFSYDVFTITDQEWTPTGDIPLWPMPQDFVSLVGVGYTDSAGIERRLRPRTDSSNPRSALQTESGAFMYNSDGSIIYQNPSVTEQRWAERRATPSYSSLSEGGYFYFEGGFDVYGKKYYTDPESTNSNGTYYINREQGTISVDMDVRNIFTRNGRSPIVVFHYVSDGLSDDLSEVKVHKFAEKAFYEGIYSELVDKRRDVPAYEKQKAMKRARAEKRNAKLRLQDSGHRELVYTIRNLNRWIKT